MLIQGVVETWVRTDETEDVAGSLRHILRAAKFVSDDLQAWKWVALAMHSALQGACVCHLTTTATPVGAVTKSNALEWMAYFNEQRTNPSATPPKTFIKSLPELLKAVRKPYSAGDRSNIKGVVISDSELAWLTRFHNDVRNQFVHFKPLGWSLEVSGIPALVLLATRIIQEILDLGYAFRHQDTTQYEEINGNLQVLSSDKWLP